MNHVKMTLTITAIVAAAALASVAFAVPQQVMAGGYGHRHHNSNSITVDQQVNQANLCSTNVTPPPVTGVREAVAQPPSGLHTICANIGSNDATIGH